MPMRIGSCRQLHSNGTTFLHSQSLDLGLDMAASSRRVLILYAISEPRDIGYSRNYISKLQENLVVQGCMVKLITTDFGYLRARHLAKHLKISALGTMALSPFISQVRRSTAINPASCTSAYSLILKILISSGGRCTLIDNRNDLL